MQRRLLWASLYVFLVATSTVMVKVNGLPKSAERLLDVPNYITRRMKRSAVDFHRSIRCYQPTVNVLGSYGNYGCFCGFSGSGYAIDATDKCCQIHDLCYAEAGEVEQTWWESVVSAAGHIIPNYSSECENGRVTCGPDSRYRHKLCECDRAASACFHLASATYHPQLQEIDTKKYCVANASFDDLNLTSYENRYSPLPTTTVLKTMNITNKPTNGSADSTSQVNVVSTRKSNDKEMTQNSFNSSMQIDFQTTPKAEIETISQVTVKSTPKSVRNATSQSYNQVRPTSVIEPYSGSQSPKIETAPRKEVELTSQKNAASPPQSNVTPTSHKNIASTSQNNVTSTPQKNVESTSKSQTEENIIKPKLIHPKKTDSNRTWETEDELDRFDDKNESNKTENRRRGPHTHKHRPNTGNTGRDNEEGLDVEVLDDSEKKNNLSVSALQNRPYVSNNTALDGSPRLLPSHSHVRTSFARRNADRPGSSASSLRPSVLSFLLQACLTFIVLFVSDFYPLLTYL